MNWSPALLIPALIFLPNCSLVTVPVKTAGSIVNTTVRTSGKVVEAPFKAASGGYRDEDNDQKRKARDDEE